MRLRQAAADRDELAAAQLAVRDAQIEALAARIQELERLLAKDSSTSSKPPSSDNPYKKKPRDRSLRGRSGRKPGKQPGAQSATLKQSADPDDTVGCGPAACGCCGHGLADVDALWMQKRQVFEAAPPPPPAVTEYQVMARQCPGCGEISVGLARAGVTGRVQYGPLVHARTALAVCAHYLPVARAARLVAALTGVAVSAGFAAGVRGKAAALLGPLLAVTVFAHESAAFGVDVLAGVGGDVRRGWRAGVGSGYAEEAGERGDGFEQQGVKAGLLVGGAAGAEVGDRAAVPGLGGKLADPGGHRGVVEGGRAAWGGAVSRG